MEVEDILHQRLLDKLNEYGTTDYTVQNSATFVGFLRSQTILDCETMVSFDVESLFTNVPITGDSLLDNEDYTKIKSKPTKLKNGRHSANNFNNQLLKTTTTFSNTSAMHKKKKKKKTRTAAKTNDEDTSIPKNTGRGQLADFEEELRQFKLEALKKKRMSVEEKETVVKRSAPEVIVFEDPSRRKKKKVENRAEHMPDQEGINLRKVRHEVRQFGLSGFSYEDREKCEVDRAISLGAWAPKKEYKNYKEYMELQKKKKDEERQQREIDRKMGYSVKKKPTEKTRVRNQGFWRDPTRDKNFFLDGQVGRYKQGVQVVSKDDVTRVRARVKKRLKAKKSNKFKF